MHPFDFFMLISDQRNTHGLSIALAYLLAAAVILTCLARQYRPHGYQAKSRMAFRGIDTRQLNNYRSACHDFDREVTAWEQAVRQKGGKL